MTVDGLQRLLLTLVTCQDHNGAKIHPIECGRHYSILTSDHGYL